MGEARAETSTSTRGGGGGGRGRWPASLRALGHRNYRLFFGGQFVSLSGSWMQSVAQSWLVYRLTGSAVMLGTVSFAGQIPVFLLAPVGGAVADRFPRHRILLCTQAASMLLPGALAALTLSGVVREWHVDNRAGRTLTGARPARNDAINQHAPSAGRRGQSAGRSQCIGQRFPRLEFVRCLTRDGAIHAHARSVHRDKHDITLLQA